MLLKCQSAVVVYSDQSCPLPHISRHAVSQVLIFTESIFENSILRSVLDNQHYLEKLLNVSRGRSFGRDTAIHALGEQRPPSNFEPPESVLPQRFTSSARPPSLYRLRTYRKRTAHRQPRIASRGVAHHEVTGS